MSATISERLYVRSASKNKLKSLNKKTTIRVRRTFIFLRFLDVSTIDSDTLVAAVYPPPEGGGELVSADVSEDPFPGLLHALRGQPKASQLLLHPPEQEIVRRSQIRRIGRVLQDLDVVGGKPILHYGGGVDRSIVPMKEPVLGHHLGSLLPQVPHEGNTTVSCHAYRRRAGSERKTASVT